MSRITLSSNATGTGTFILSSPGTNDNRTLTLPDATTTLVGTDATQTLTNKTIQGGTLTLTTPVATTSGTAIDITGIPSWAKRVTVLFSGVSTSGTSKPVLQIGTSSGFKTSEYTSAWANVTGGSTVGFFVGGTSAGDIRYGSISLVNVSGTFWVSTGAVMTAVGSAGASAGGADLGGVLDRVRLTTENGTDAFDAGSINIMYEG